MGPYTEEGIGGDKGQRSMAKPLFGNAKGSSLSSRPLPSSLASCHVAYMPCAFPWDYIHISAMPPKVAALLKHFLTVAFKSKPHNGSNAVYTLISSTHYIILSKINLTNHLFKIIDINIKRLRKCKKIICQ